MKLSDIFAGISRQTTSGKEVQETEKQNHTTEYVNRQIKALTPGKILQGEVVSKTGSEVQIKLSDEVTLTARLDKDINVETGRLITFEVKNNGSSLALSPLFSNMATADNVFKALQMANLPVSEATVSMTETMMKQGMSVDSNSLQCMFREVMANPGASAESIVELQRMGMPVNEDNLQQIENYKSLTHELVKGMTDILAELPAAFEMIAEARGLEPAVQMYKELIESLLPEEIRAENTLKNPDTVAFQKEGMSGMEAVTEQASEPGISGVEMEIKSDEKQPFLENTTGRVLSREEREAFAELLQDIPEENCANIERAMQVLRDETADPAQILRILAGMTGRGEKEAEVWKSPVVGKLLEAVLLRECFIKPEEVAEEKNIKEMYQRLQKHLENAGNILKQNGGGESTAAKNVAGMSRNLDFMNQMNQMYTYVQLPLQMQEGRTNGELYVYTNKRSLAQKEGNVSALLHLDMENLGPVDVYVAMQNEHVSTHFTLANDETLSFLNAHMHILTERLEKKGYHTQVEMKVQPAEEQAHSPIERILQADKNNTVLKQYAFDVRA